MVTTRDFMLKLTHELSMCTRSIYSTMLNEREAKNDTSLTGQLQFGFQDRYSCKI